MYCVKAAFQHQNNAGELPRHIECDRQCRSSIISKYIELYPEALAHSDFSKCQPLLLVLDDEPSTIDVTLLIIEAYPAALLHPNHDNEFPIHLECGRQCR
jgi:hypothetical protein